MTQPHFAKAVLEQNVVTTLTTLPNSITFATGTWNVVNTGTEVAKVRLGYGNGTTMTLVDCLDFSSVVPANGGVLIRSCVLIPPGSKIFVHSDKPDVVANFSALMQELVS